ncbi:MAG: Uma2 family endonuclease [Cyanomargarita calcarea GSE-NOS-MK-12-04C]|jgi:Uma2 family endonuclease|uniref:Uma2 family endonuclease n=1 Tax=Cyanomargarita calcarea GSE-NOS-MK-12-04C TaxID=2839659 RepID=A0A951UTN6_9CYAN|nr:Uma2 family endonuclease [Cyanomargarita calcarea GSE-NOS-MK-12-04C]
MITLQLQQLSVPPGHRVILHNVNWQEFEAILEELGEHRATRLAYSQGTLEIRMPLPKHEVAKVLIGDLVKILLEELEIDCEPFGSTTFKREDMASGVEPDDSFYIQNHARMIGKERIDLTVDPPPDLAIEVDVTSKTQLNAYEALGVPELWRYEDGKLQINLIKDGKYIESEISATFPNLPIFLAIPRFVEQSKTVGRSPTLRAFRLWVREQI